MTDEAREQKRLLEEVARRRELERDAQIARDMEWSNRVSACVPEFVAAAGELKLRPDKRGLFRRTWLLKIPTSLVPISSEDPGVPTQGVAVYSDGTWELVQYWVVYDTSKPVRLQINRQGSDSVHARDVPAEEVRAYFVARLNRGPVFAR